MNSRKRKTFNRYHGSFKNYRNKSRLGSQNRAEQVLCSRRSGNPGEGEEQIRDLTELWLHWTEWESLWIQSAAVQDVITWNIGPQGVDYPCSRLPIRHHTSRPPSASWTRNGSERVCCLLALNSVTSTPQWIRQPEAAWLHTRGCDQEDLECKMGVCGGHVSPQSVFKQ